MMITTRHLYFLIFPLLLLYACEDVSAPSTTNQGNLTTDGWLIPEDQIFDGGPGKDGIPALTNPLFIASTQAGYLNDDDLVVVYQWGNEQRAYPHAILNWHEIVNDAIDSKKISVSYCPLTGSAIAINTEFSVDGLPRQTTFGVSGLLYNSNLIMYDRLTDSYWSQMLLKCVSGRLRGMVPETQTIIETRFAAAKSLFPQLKVLSNATGVYDAVQYSIYPYGNYRTDHNRLLFPVANDDSRLPRKQRVLGVLPDARQRAYQFNNFSQSRVINDQLGDLPLVIAGSDEHQFMVAFIGHDAQNQVLNFSEADCALPCWMQDEKGNHYDVFGKVIEGPDKDYQLQAVPSFVAFWFALAAFYPDIEIYSP
jgi:hypothetical protein